MKGLTLALAAAVWATSPGPIFAASRPVAVKTAKYLTRGEFALSIVAHIEELEKLSGTPWKAGTEGGFTLRDLPDGDPARPVVMRLVNGFHLWDGIPAVKADAFGAGQPVTRGEVERVLRNLWSIREMQRYGPRIPVAIALPAGMKPTARVTRQQYAQVAKTTFAMIREVVRLARAKADMARASAEAAKAKEAAIAQAAASAVASEEAHRLAAIKEEEASSAQRAAAQEAESARLAREQAARIAQFAQESNLQKSAEIAKAEREKLAAQAAAAAQRAQLKQQVAQAAAEAVRAREELARREAAEARRQAEIRERNARFHGLRPVQLSLSSMPWFQASLPVSPYQGPSAAADATFYPGAAFVTAKGRLGMYPGSSGTVSAAGGPAIPTLDMGRVAALQLQPYVGAMGSLGWTDLSLSPSAGPLAGMLGHLRLGQVAVFGTAETAVPIDGTTFQAAIAPLTTLTAGIEYELSPSVALTASWDAAYGPQDFLPYSGALTTGINLGF